MSEVEREAGRSRQVIGASFLSTFVWVWAGRRVLGGGRQQEGESEGHLHGLHGLLGWAKW